MLSLANIKPEETLREKDKKAPVSPETLHTAASKQPLEVPTESFVRIPDRFAQILCESASHQSARKDNEADVEVGKEEDSNPGLREG